MQHSPSTTTDHIHFAARFFDRNSYTMDRRLRRPRRTEDVSSGPLLAQSKQPTLLPVTRRTGSVTAAAATATATAGPATRTRASPSRNKVVAPPSPDLGPRTRRSSRPRSSVGPLTGSGSGSSLPIKAAIKARTPIPEVSEVSSPAQTSFAGRWISA